MGWVLSGMVSLTDDMPSPEYKCHLGPTGGCGTFHGRKRRNKSDQAGSFQTGTAAAHISTLKDWWRRMMSLWCSLSAVSTDGLLPSFRRVSVNPARHPIIIASSSIPPPACTLAQKCYSDSRNCKPVAVKNHTTQNSSTGPLSGRLMAAPRHGARNRRTTTLPKLWLSPDPGSLTQHANHQPSRRSYACASAPPSLRPLPKRVQKAPNQISHSHTAPAGAVLPSSTRELQTPAQWLLRHGGRPPNSWRRYILPRTVSELVAAPSPMTCVQLRHRFQASGTGQLRRAISSGRPPNEAMAAPMSR